MLWRKTTCVLAVAGAVAAITPARAFEDAKYPDLSGQWVGVRIPGVGGQPGFDPTKPWGRGQQAPLTAEYQAVLEKSLADQANGGQGNWHTGASCLPPGMPGMMNLYQAMQIVVLPEITYILIDHAHDSHRRIYTDGRDWPKEPVGTFLGYSIGKWIDEDGDGRYDVLEVETRNFNGPRSFDNAGIPLHADNQTVVKERIYRDKQNPEIIHDVMTTIDHALTRPWTVDKTYRLQKNPRWVQNICSVGNMHVQIGKDAYFLSADGLLMPTRKDQPPPDLRYFKQTSR
jgi:hypothetical protein